MGTGRGAPRPWEVARLHSLGAGLWARSPRGFLCRKLQLGNSSPLTLAGPRSLSCVTASLPHTPRPTPALRSGRRGHRVPALLCGPGVVDSGSSGEHMASLGGEEAPGPSALLDRAWHLVLFALPCSRSAVTTARLHLLRAAGRECSGLETAVKHQHLSLKSSVSGFLGSFVHLCARCAPNTPHIQAAQ